MVIAPGSEFSQTTATAEQLQTLATAEATLATETQTLSTLQATETAATTNLQNAQANLQAANTAVAAMDAAITAAQTAITETVEAITAVQTAQTVVEQEVILQSPIGAPTNIVVTQLENGDVQVSWDPPTGVISPERYAISWSVGDSGWGVATGNAGDANALNTSIVLSAALFESTGGLDTTYQISVRSDNDSLAKYSTTTATQLLVVDPTPAPEPQPSPQPEPNPNPNPEPQPDPETEPTPTQPEPEPETPQEPQPEPEPEPTTPEEENPSEPPTEPEPEPETPVEPEPEPETPVEPEPEPETPVEPEPEPETPVEPEPEPETPVEPETEPTPETIIEDALSDGVLTQEEKAVVVEAILENLAPGEAVTSEQLQEAGVTYEDLPPETPVETRTDEDGNPVIITAEVAAALVLLENPAELLGEIFSDPGQVLLALGSIGADMSEEEREEAEKMVVATVVAAGAAIQAAAGAAGAAGSSSGGSGGGSGGGGASGKMDGTRRRTTSGRVRKVK
jgi:hypothetical protein